MRAKTLALGLSLVILGCSTTPSADEVQAWERNCQRHLIPGYSDFQGYFVDDDIAAWIFSYKVPQDLTASEAFRVLKDRFPKMTVFAETSTTLALRKNVRAMYYDEYRFVFSSAEHRITVLDSNIDSLSEVEA